MMKQTLAECLSLPGRVIHGQTREEVVEKIRQTIQLDVTVLKEDQLPVPEERFDTLLATVSANFQKFRGVFVRVRWVESAFDCAAIRAAL